MTDLSPWGAVAASDAPTALYLPPARTGRAQCPDHDRLDITSDLDVRACVALDTWTPPTAWAFVAKVEAGTTPSCSWQFYVNTNGTLSFGWSANGSTTMAAVASAVPAPPIPPGAVRWVRVTFDADDGASQRVATFYLSTDGQSWSLLSRQPQAGQTSIFASTAPLVVGGRLVNGATNMSMAGRVFSAEVRSSIDGPVVASPNFAAQPAGTTAFTDAQGNPWSVVSPAAVQSLRGKVSSIVARARAYVDTSTMDEIGGFASNITAPYMTVPAQFTVSYFAQAAKYQQSYPTAIGQATDTAAGRLWALQIYTTPILDPGRVRFIYMGTDAVWTTIDMGVPNWIPVKEPHLVAVAVDAAGGMLSKLTAYRGTNAAQLPGPDNVTWEQVMVHTLPTPKGFVPAAQRLSVGNYVQTSAAWPSRWRGPFWWGDVRAGLVPGQGAVLGRWDSQEWSGVAATPWVDPRGRTWSFAWPTTTIRTPGIPQQHRATVSTTPRLRATVAATPRLTALVGAAS